MNLAAFAVRRPQLTLVLFAMLATIGLHSLLNIPRAEDPSFPIPTFVVTAIFPGASAYDVEQLVVDPLEDRYLELDDVDDVKSRSEDGLAVIVIDFEAGADPERKYEEVIRETNVTRPELPEGLARLEVKKVQAHNVAILQFALLSEDAPWRQLEREAERLQDRLETVPGVKKVRTWAYPEAQVRVEIDPARPIPVTRVLQALRGDSATIPGGGVDIGSRRFNVDTGGAFASVEDVADVVIATDGARLVRLGDVARVGWGNAEESYIGRVDGRRAVFVTVEQRDLQNIFAVRDAVLRQVDAFGADLPAGVQIELVHDQSTSVAHRLHGLGRDFVLAIALVLVTLLPLGIRAASIVMVSIPLSLAIGVALLHATGFSINQLSIVGFVIALGLLVDDSIVVTENVTRFLRLGYSRARAAVEATRQIGVAVLGCTATLMLAFLPLLALPGGSGQFARSLPLAVLFTIGASLVVSLTIIPFLASVVLREQGPEGNAVFRAMHHGIERVYRPLLRVALAWPRTTVAVSAVVSVAALAIVPTVGFSLFPKADVPQFLVAIETPQGSSLAETDAAARFAEAVLARHPEVKRVIANVGRGNPQIFYNALPAEEKSNVGELFVLLREYAPQRTPALLNEIRAELAAYPRARLWVKEFQNGPPVDALLAIRVFAPDLDQLRQLAERVEGAIEATDGTRYVNNPLRVAKTDLAVRVDAAQAGRFGIPESEVQSAVRLAIAGVKAGTLRDSRGEEYDVRVTLPQGARPTLAALDRLRIATSNGVPPPLRQLAVLELDSAPPRIDHHDKLRSVTVSADVRLGYNTDRVTRQVMARLADMPWPAATRWEPAGEYEAADESFGGLGTAFLVAAFGILAVLVLEFRTFKSTLIVASVIPLGVMGGLVALLLVGYSLSFTAAIGFIALIGIEVKNSILLVDFTDQLRAQGVGLDEAIERAGQARFFPILLTTLTALGGMLPLALEQSPLYSPLAVVIMGGLISSTVLARLVTPVLYKLLEPVVEMAADEVTPGQPA
ncbi:efflux RND transporter permease subunit [Candidatus Binatia bacterium]|nr:efflux RND transporter permease subunit [Candidatus Binatia bacterium]